MNMPTITSFYCPNCNQHFESETLRPGGDCQCTECQFKFRVPADPDRKAAPAVPESALTAEDREMLRQIETDEAAQREHLAVQELFDSASGTSGAGNFFLVVAVIALCVAVVQMVNSENAANAGSICGIFLALGLAHKILSQLIYIRAEIRANRKELYLVQPGGCPGRQNSGSGNGPFSRQERPLKVS
jgi:DNA-directed RNA polymerase subunit RPC12/RpoP